VLATITSTLRATSSWASRDTPSGESAAPRSSNT
jgi:hypothetical protein